MIWAKSKLLYNFKDYIYKSLIIYSTFQIQDFNVVFVWIRVENYKLWIINILLLTVVMNTKIFENWRGKLQIIFYENWPTKDIRKFPFLMVFEIYLQWSDLKSEVMILCALFFFFISLPYRKINKALDSFCPLYLIKRLISTTCEMLFIDHCCTSLFFSSSVLNFIVHTSYLS